jgi:hypothetical protein
LVKNLDGTVGLDDYSRAAYVEVLPDQTGRTVAGFLRRTVGWFARRGVAVARVLTDNGSGYRSDRFAPRRIAVASASRAHARTAPKPTGKPNDSFKH